MSDSGPLDPDDEGQNPFQGMPFLFGDLAGMLQQQGGMGWEAARQVAVSVAAGGRAEANVDPAARIHLEELARVADLHVATETGLSTSTAGSPLRITAVTRTAWARDTLTAWRPLFEELAGALHGTEPAEPEPSDLGSEDPMGFLRPLMEAMGPMLLTITAGSMVGHLSRRCFGPYTLPIPRGGHEIGIVLGNVDEFGEAWSLPDDDLRLWICVHEAAHHAVLGVPHVRGRLEGLLHDYLAGFEPDSTALESRLADLAPTAEGLEDVQQVLNDPEFLLGAIQSPRQRQMLPQLEALVAVVVGYVDHVLDTVGRKLLSSYGQVTEAVRRRRVEADPSDRFVEKLFGLELSQATYDRGQEFVGGVLERGGDAGLARLWSGPRELPTPSEVDAPGLWLARIDLPD